SAERVVHTAGAAGAEGQIGDEIAVTASVPASAAIAVSPAAVTAGSEDAEPQDRSAQGGKTPSSHSHGFSSLSTRACKGAGPIRSIPVLPTPSSSIPLILFGT